MKKMSVFLLSLLLVLSGCATSSTKESIPTPSPTIQPSIEPIEKVSEMRLFMAGDALLHRYVYSAAKTDTGFDFMPMMERIGSLNYGYDLSYYNQETILGGTELGLSAYPRFNSPQEFGDTMMKLGFNLVSLANNHSLDKDEEGVKRSNAYWKKQSALATGTFDSFEEQQAIPVREVNGITYTLLSYTYGCNGLVPPSGKEYMVNIYPGHEQQMFDQIKQAKEKVDVVLVAMHWGIEYQHEPSQQQKDLAKKLVEAGATVVIGNHPHVIQPMEKIGDSYVFYALGNMVSCQDGVERLTGAVASILIRKTEEDGKAKIETLDPRADLIYTYFYHENGRYLCRVIPYNELDDNQLPNHKHYEEEFSKILTKYDPNVGIGRVRLTEDDMYGCSLCAKRRRTYNEK